MKKILFLSLTIMLMVATRGHNNWLSALVHLPDFTLPALFIAGVYFRKFWVAMVIILSAVAIDNYAIVHQGVSANCITPAYSILLLTYYGVFWVGKYLTSLKINADIIKNMLIIVLTSSLQWLVATVSYYTFTTSPWATFPAYVAHWSLVEIPLVLVWMVAVIIALTLIPRFAIILSLKKSDG